MPTAPPSITALPAAPDPNNRSTFNALAYPWSAALPTFGTEVSAVATNVKANADEAQADAVATAADRIQTGLDVVATAADRVQTDSDRTSATNSAIAAAASAAAAAGAAAFVDTNPVVKGSVDATKQVRFEVDGLTTATTRVLTVPDADLTLVGVDTAQTLTNKTIAGATNDVEARSLKSATTTVSVASATASSSGQVLTATSSTAATWQTPAAPAGGSLIYLSTVTASGATEADVETGFSSTYDDYIIIADNIFGSAGGQLLARYKITGAYVTSGSYSSYQNITGATTYSGYQTINGTSFGLSQASDIPTSIGSAPCFQINVFGANSAANKTIRSFGTSITANGAFMDASGRNSSSTGVLSGVRFFCTSGTITGTFKLYGVKKS